MKINQFIGLVLVINVLLSCSKPQGFEYRDVKNITIQQLGFNKSTIKMDLVYFNPNKFGVDLKHVDCDIYIDKNYLGKFILDTTMHIDKKSEFALPSTIQVDMKNIYKNSLTVLFNQEVLITVKGNTRVGKSGIFLNMPFNYEERHKISL
jgi:LEA14-like dessication related protein